MTTNDELDIIEDEDLSIDRYFTNHSSYLIMNMLSQSEHDLENIEKITPLSERSVYRKLAHMVDQGLVKIKENKNGKHVYVLTCYGLEILSTYKYFRELCTCSAVFKSLENCQESGLNIDLTAGDQESIKTIYISGHHLGRIKVLSTNEKILQTLNNVSHMAKKEMLLATRYFSPKLIQSIEPILNGNLPCRILISSDFDLKDLAINLISSGRERLEKHINHGLLSIRLANMQMSYALIDDCYVLQEMPKSEGLGYHYFLSLESNELAKFLKNTFNSSWDKSLNVDLISLMDSITSK